MKHRFLLVVLSVVLSQAGLITAWSQDSDFEWKAGVAKVVITPKENIWMAGYGSRTKPAEGKLHDLWAKALFLEDSSENSVLLITSDLLGFPKALSNKIRDRISAELNLDYSQIILSSSHTHSGPALSDALSNIYPIDSEQEKRIREYSDWLIDQIIDISIKSKKFLKPAKIYAENGVVRFQVNRRNNSESNIGELYELKGPNDYAVPVLKVEYEEGTPAAIVFGYACHPTVLNGYLWSGDYPGFAQLELEGKFIGATAMFFQGAGADQNPLPRRTIPLAKQYGQELAAAVERVLNEDMRPLSPKLKTAYSEIDIELDNPPSVEELKKINGEYSGYMKKWAAKTLNKIENEDKLPESYPYPVQIWQLDDQIITILGGELLIHYAIKLKEALGKDIFVMGYSNDLMAYIPSEIVLEEGGYEGETSQMVYGLPSKWKSGIEKQILTELIKMAQQQKIPQQ